MGHLRDGSSQLLSVDARACQGAASVGFSARRNHRCRGLDT